MMNSRDMVPRVASSAEFLGVYCRRNYIPPRRKTMMEATGETVYTEGSTNTDRFNHQRKEDRLGT